MDLVDMYYRNFAMQFPYDAAKAVEYYLEDGGYHLIVILNDGRRVSFDVYEESSRYLPNSDDVDEERFRLEFGRRLRRIMDFKHINQLELSKKTGISNVTISKYICGKATPSFYNAVKIARVLDCSITELILNYRKGR